MFKSFITGLLAAGIVAGSTSLVSAGSKYGALAFSQTSGAYGYSYGFASTSRAQRVALANCRANGGGCRIIYTFWNQCAALAIGNRFGYGYGASPSLSVAKSVAMANCRANDRGCYIAEYACT